MTIFETIDPSVPPGSYNAILNIQCTVDAVVVVIQSPTVDHPTGFFQAQEQLPVQ